MPNVCWLPSTSGMANCKLFHSIGSWPLLVINTVSLLCSYIERSLDPGSAETISLLNSWENERILERRGKTTRRRGVKMKIFVAGATGVIGRRLIPLLVASGYEV